MVDITLGILSYNRPQFLYEAVESALNQSVLPEQIIIYDNGSRPDTKDAVKELLTKGVKWKGVEQNINPKYILEKGFSECDTEYIMFLHDDDRLHSNFLEKQFAILDKYPGLAALSCNGKLIDNAGTEIGSTISSYKRKEFTLQIYEHPGQAALRYASNSCIPLSPTIYRKRVVQDFKITEGYGKCGDAVFLCDLAAYGGVGYTTLPLYDCRIHLNQDSNSFPLDQVQKLENYFFALPIVSRADKALLDRLLIQRHTARNTKRALKLLPKGHFHELVDLFLDPRFKVSAFIKELACRIFFYKSEYQ
ncbi:hypothetical protein DP176_02905 [Polynucleobacter paneuropaeus]|uniref:Glycosyltransferase 2-like domain-containing protein n=1 Tax=Polynucleobacter paneuropaeus TaxID=2527775 RepID=A0ABX9FCL9_9BURK|nr:glycosyltransferase family A protein [Polynucleobacter paneuropaeus]MBT8520008.1 glycosyltransferase family 2 protein [Polynucleobacter paneuropaeus]QWD18341.1 glycosyltransferase family 2 protein [Polynucleobacter paneuropaeus]RAZ43931.1 hypothetical protein DP176_02905 [Polynucleobacter paneuropaeus]